LDLPILPIYSRAVPLEQRKAGDPKTVITPRYEGEGGMGVYNLDLKDYQLKMTRYEEMRPRMWAALIQNTHQVIRLQIEILPVYQQKEISFDYLWLYNIRKQISTGDSGDYTIMAELLEFFKIKLPGDTLEEWHGFATEFTKYIRKIKEHVTSGKMTYEQLFDTMIDANFFLATAGRKIVEPERSDALKSTASKKSAIELINIISTAVRVRTSLDKAISVADSGKVTAHAAISPQSKKKPSTSQCWNCASPLHKFNDCPKKPSVCGTCGESHLTSILFFWEGKLFS